MLPQQTYAGKGAGVVARVIMEMDAGERVAEDVQLAPPLRR
jgi:hypothetical protein